MPICHGSHDDERDDICSPCESKRIADNLEYIAASLAKLTERCFCGHRFDHHTPACTVENCEVSDAGNCKAFTPWFLAITRIANVGVMQFMDFKQLIASMAGAGRQPQDSGIVKPFTH